MSACDIGNPIYDRSQSNEYGKGIVIVDIWFDGGNEFKRTEINYEWEEVPGGIELYVTLPNLEFEADDAREDIGQRMREILRPHHIVNTVWLPEIKTIKTQTV